MKILKYFAISLMLVGCSESHIQELGDINSTANNTKTAYLTLNENIGDYISEKQANFVVENFNQSHDHWNNSFNMSNVLLNNILNQEDCSGLLVIFSEDAQHNPAPVFVGVTENGEIHENLIYFFNNGEIELFENQQELFSKNFSFRNPFQFNSHFVGKNILIDQLSSNEAEGLNFKLGLDNNEVCHMVYTPYNMDGLITSMTANKCYPCPNECDGPIVTAIHSSIETLTN